MKYPSRKNLPKYFASKKTRQKPNWFERKRHEEFEDAGGLAGAFKRLYGSVPSEYKTEGPGPWFSLIAQGEAYIEPITFDANAKYEPSVDSLQWECEQIENGRFLSRSFQKKK